MRRLVFLAPTVSQVNSVVADFLAVGIEDESIHFIAEDESLIEKISARAATDIETTERENDLDWGMVAGGSFGLAAGLVATTVLGPVGSVVSGGTVVVSSILGIGLGGWLGKLVGEDTPVHLLAKYKHALQQGGVLVMVDIPAERMTETHKLIRQHCPKALVEIIHLHWDHQQAA
ncbi:hypothetical protein ACMXYO_12855 [Neptuniibacter sp. QD37_6]|uniref:hypothetical protein n=1 Tax=Neptuniibacter sp. QD37_6 TaxID=3398210 RepID=UPI0039F46B55